MDMMPVSGAHSTNPTIGTLETLLLRDTFLSQLEKEQAMAKLKAELRYMPASTPLTPQLLSKLGGGALGMVIARYLRMGFLGSVLTAAAGYSIGKVISDFYTPGNQVRTRTY